MASPVRRISLPSAVHAMFGHEGPVQEISPGRDGE
jgi:hypothetical protein